MIYCIAQGTLHTLRNNLYGKNIWERIGLWIYNWKMKYEKKANVKKENGTLYSF